jgi:photosystem II stability/assembly factor-like uncharacterized protein
MRYITVLILLLFFAHPNSTLAHLPHDDITLLEVSPGFSKDQFLIITERNNLFRSTDGGTSWKRLVQGLDYDTEITAIAIADDFENSKTLYMATNGDGIFKSENAGDSWQKINTGLSTMQIDLLYAPQCSGMGLIFAAGKNGALFKSENGGKNWDEVVSVGKINKIETMILYKDSRKLLIGGQKGEFCVFDYATNFFKILNNNPDRGAINVIALPPDAKSNEFFLVGTQKHGILKTVDGGMSFAKIEPAFSNQPIMSLAFSPDYYNNLTIYAITWFDGMYCSKDNGKTWQILSKGLTKDSQADTGNLPHFRSIKMSNDFENDGVMFLNGFDSLFKSVDRGITWRALETFSAKIILDFDISPAYRDDSQIAFVTYAGAAYTLDTSYGYSYNIGNYGKIGYVAIRRPVIKFSPNYVFDKSIFSASNDVFLKSDNGGKSWKKYRLFNIPGLPQFLEKYFNKAEYYKRQYLATMIVPSPDIAADNTLYIATRKQGLFRSTNNGETFKEIFPNNKHVTKAMAISPNFAIDNVLYIGITGDKKIYKTTDRGDTWQSANKTGIIKKNVNCIAISPDFSEDNTVFVGTSQGLFKSSDAGESWDKLNVNAFNGYNHIEAIAISPNFNNDRELIVGIRGAGICKSQDAGVNFRQIGASLIENNYTLSIYYGFPERPLPIKYSPYYRMDQTIFGISGDELFVSKNGGENWKIIPRPIRYEDFRRDVITYENESDWVKLWYPKEFEGYSLSASSITYADVKGANANFCFYGTGITWIGTESKTQGIANVYIDDQLKCKVDQYSPVKKINARLFTIRGLENKPHTLTIEVSGSKNKNSEGYRTVIDAIDILPSFEPNIVSEQ